MKGVRLQGAFKSTGLDDTTRDVRRSVGPQRKSASVGGRVKIGWRILDGAGMDPSVRRTKGRMSLFLLDVGRPFLTFLRPKRVH